jgi:hypothetical protein
MPASGALDALLSTSFVSLLQEFIGLLRQAVAFVEERRLQGLYDVLEQRRTITLLDPQGHMATVDTIQRLRFRQNHITALTDYAWGEGELFADYRCTPGVPVDCYRVGSRQVLLISLREHQNAGDQLCLRTHRRIERGFVRREEYWESDVYHRTQRMQLRIIFPKERPCQRATVTARSTGQAIALGPACYQTLPDGRMALVWAKARAKLHERYLLRWIW